jgi:hypothetical protein
MSLSASSEFSGTLYALLVGIDVYPPPLRRLWGCVNDVQEMADYLEEWARRNKSARLETVQLRDAQATRQAVLAGFREHLSRAWTGDVVFFAYSGHGSQEQPPGGAWAGQADRLNETLVCYDSRLPGPDHWDLADVELFALLGEVAGRAGQVVVVLDCCHSLSGMRDPLPQAGAVRCAPIDQRLRPLDSYLASVQEAGRTGEGGRFFTVSGWRDILETPSILFRACRDHEEAVECYGGGVPRGAFSYALSTALRSTPGSLSYRDLYAQIDARLASQTIGQRPLLEAGKNANLEAPFLEPVGGTSRRAEAGFSQPSQLLVQIDKGQALEDDQGAQLVRAALAGLAPDGKPSGYAREARKDELPRFHLLAEEGRYLLIRPDGEPVFAPINGYSEENAGLAVRRLEHIARWELTADLDNPVSLIRADEVVLTIRGAYGKVLVGPEICLKYTLRGQTWVEPRFQVEVSNRSGPTLYATLLVLTETYGISAALLEGGCQRLERGQTIYALGGNPILAVVPEALWRHGVGQCRDILKLIVSTRPFDASLLEQPDLDTPTARATEFPGLPPVRRVGSRLDEPHDPRAEDWRTERVMIATVRPREASVRGGSAAGERLTLSK